MTAEHLRLLIAQSDPRPGAVSANLEAARSLRAEAAAAGADALLLPSLFLSGHHVPAAIDPAVIADCMAAIRLLADETADGGPVIVVGTPWRDGDRLRNTVAVLDRGRIEALRHETATPGGPVPPFAPAPLAGPVGLRGVRIGLLVDGDLDSPDCAECLAETGADLLIALAAAPHREGAADRRLQRGLAQVIEAGLPLIAVHRLGGDRGEVHAGGSFVLQADRTLAVQLPAFARATAAVDLTRGQDGRWRAEAGVMANLPTGRDADRAACRLAIAGAVRSADAAGALVHLDGTFEAEMAADLAAEALGPHAVVGLLVDNGTAETAANGHARPGIRIHRLDAAALFAAFRTSLSGAGAPVSFSPDHLHDALSAAFAEAAGLLRLTPRPVGQGLPARHDPFAMLGPDARSALVADGLTSRPPDPGAPG